MLRSTLRIIGVSTALLILLILAACGEDSATETAEPATVAPSAGTSDATPASGTSTSAPPSPTTGTGASTAGPTATPLPQPAEPINVVTTSNIVGDWVRIVGQERVDVFSLLPPDADPHTFQPGTRDVARVADADLVMSIGLSLEAGWLEELVENTARDHDLIIPLGEFVDAISFAEAMHEEGEHADELGGEQDAELMGRLLIGDGETGAMSVIDLEHDEVEQNAFDLGSRAGRIYATHDGRFAIAVSSDANEVHVFDGGIYLEEHGDHFDLVEDPVSRLDIDLSGDRPVHLYVGDEWAAIYYDGSGEVALLELHELEEEGSNYMPAGFNAGPHHGAAVPLEGDLFAVSTQHPDYDSNPDDYGSPIGADIRDVEGNILYSAEGCEGLHGDASNGHMAVFGCIGGVLAVEAHDGEYSHSFIAAPDGEPEDFRLTTVWGYRGLDHFFALGSAVGLYVIEPEEGEMSQLIASSESLKPINASVSHDGEALIVVMSDGELRMYDAHDLDLLASASGFLTTPLETGFWGRPHIATAPGAVFVTDSVGGEVMQLDAHDLEVVEHWDVEGAPTKIAFVGIMGEPGDHEEHGHEEEDEHGHEEDEDEHGQEEDAHGHDHGDLDPHFWFDPIEVQKVILQIALELSSLDPAGQDFYLENAEAYNNELDELHHWIEDQVGTVEESRRVMVTSHDSFGYFARRYGFEIAGSVIPGSTTEIEPTAKDLVQLIETIEHEGAPAVFTERQHNDRLARYVAEETGAKLVTGLYTGSLGEQGGEAGNYLDMMRHNVGVIVEALR